MVMIVKPVPIRLRVIMYSIQSGSIKAVGYNKDSQQMLVAYRNCSVLYMKIPGKVFKAMMIAVSIASFFSKNIRNKYACVRLT